MEKNQIFKLIEQNKSIIDRYHISKLGLFGSYVHGRQKKNSDIDFLVEFSSVPDLFDYYHLKKSMEDIFNKKVDLCTVDAIKPVMKDKVLDEVEWVEGL